MVERHHAERLPDLLDVVERLAVLLAQQDELVGADRVGQDVVHRPAAAADLGHQPLADDPAHGVGQPLPDQLLLVLVEHADDAVDRLAGVHRV